MTQLQNLFFHEKSLERYTDRTVLELLLTTAGITGDIPTMINGLYSTFGTFRGILDAQPEQLMKVPHITKRAASMIAMVTPLAKVLERSSMENPDTIRSLTDAESFCKSLLLGERNEQFYVIALNCQCNVLGCRKISEGTLNQVQAYPRKIVEAALNYNACAVVLCHNHPGGTCKPSQEDIKTTKHLQKALRAVGVQILDHLIVSANGTYSMVQNNDIEYAESDRKKSKSKAKAEKHRKKKS
ncbi:MAG: DNA repair protein RadC [Lachnospiraceae bacterium]|nr:DNA repair protein RadC [Lachnospiraceae bacterium]